MHATTINGRKALVILCVYFFSFFSNSASATDTISSVSSFIESEQLWDRVEWHNLLHYQPDDTESGYLSQVDDSRFFLADDGKQNPRSELLKDLEAFYAPAPEDIDEHAQCRFIARFNWLKQTLGNRLSDVPAVECKTYNEWRKNVSSHKVSLIFPAYHLNSPSSMFGHTLLRIDPADDEQGSTLLSNAVNFGANIDSNDNSILFAVKGLAGGYAGQFIVTPYYKKIKEYNRHENRDIWEYPLNLTPEETQRIVLHLWELKDINFDYYFFDENCSYRLLELLEVARPGLKLKDQFGLTAIPVDTVRAIEDAQLINGIAYRPSLSTNIHYMLDQLTASQQQLAYEISQDAGLTGNEAFTSLPPQTRMIILDTAYNYLRYRQHDEGRSDTNARNSFILLQQINATDNFITTKAGYEEQQRPELGHLSKRLTLAAGEDADEEFLEVKFRMSFHSLEDNINGFLEGAQINLGSLSFRATREDFQLQHFDVVDIFSLTPRNRFFQPLSWKVYTGLEQQIINGEDHLVAHVTAGAGVTYQPWRHGYTYLLVTTRLESSSQYDKLIEPAIGFDTGLLHHFASAGTSHLSISGEEFSNDQYRHRIDFRHNFPLARNHSIDISLRRQRQPEILFTEAMLNYHYFFH